MNTLNTAQPPLVDPELILEGLASSRGIAIGKVYLYRRDKVRITDESLLEHDVPVELERFVAALERSEKELKKIAGVTEQKIGADYSGIFDAQIMVLHDASLIHTITERIRHECRSASVIVDEEFSKFQKLLLASGDSMFRERADDLIDLKERIIRNLHEAQLFSRIDEHSIVISDMLTPADIILFSRQHILGCAADSGGLTSHVSLICRSLGIPMVAGLRNVAGMVKHAQDIIIDGYDGKVILNPKPETRDFYERKARRRRMSAAEISRLSAAETRTRCGQRIHIYSNIDFKEELGAMEKSGSEGIGLFRSESLFISRGKSPTESEQLEYYTELARGVLPMPLVIRLFDVGGDKLLFASYKELNPNLGWRGIRILLDVPEILETQLRAVLRAGAASGGNISVMLPMIASMEEVRAVKRTVEKVKAQLRRDKIAFDDKMKLGVMIEVPAAVEIAHEITAEVDFVSIGTNDLIQYTLAVDRNNITVQNLYNRFHPAVVRMVARVIKAANQNECKVSMCGEMAADATALPLLLGLGLKEFSVVTSSIPDMKKRIAMIRLSTARRVAVLCLKKDNAYEIEQTLKQLLR